MRNQSNSTNNLNSSSSFHNTDERAVNAMPIVVGIVNQKGGVGKTTITTLLANLFHFYFGYRVAIIDADMPQYSIVKKRQLELQLIQENPTYQAAFKRLYKKVSEVKQDQTSSSSNPLIAETSFQAVTQAMAVYPSNTEDALGVLQTISASDGNGASPYDIIFVDIAGTINQKGIVEIFKEFHYFFIPIYQDGDTLNSSYEFHSILKKFIEPHSDSFKSAHFFFNRVRHQNILKKLIPEVQAIGSLLSEKMFDYRAYERKMRSTVFPIPLQEDRNPYYKEVSLLLRFAKAILKIIDASKWNRPIVPCEQGISGEIITADGFRV